MLGLELCAMFMRKNMCVICTSVFGLDILLRSHFNLSLKWFHILSHLDQCQKDMSDMSACQHVYPFLSLSLSLNGKRANG